MLVMYTPTFTTQVLELYPGLFYVLHKQVDLDMFGIVPYSAAFLMAPFFWNYKVIEQIINLKK